MRTQNSLPKLSEKMEIDYVNNKLEGNMFMCCTGCQNNQKICPATTRDPRTDTPVSFALLDGPTDRSFDGSSGLGHGIREEIESGSLKYLFT